MILFKSLLHNIGVLFVGFIFAFIGVGIDMILKITEFRNVLAIVAGFILLAIGFLIRVWATFYFYKRHMSVIRLEPQKELLTSGPFRFSRNPLYLGGNVFIFLGAVLVLGSPSGIVLTAAAIIATDFMIRREERQLARDFGEQWTDYKNKVRRWI